MQHVPKTYCVHVPGLGANIPVYHCVCEWAGHVILRKTCQRGSWLLLWCAGRAGDEVQKDGEGYFGKTLWTTCHLICISKNRQSFIDEEHGGEENR